MLSVGLYPILNLLILYFLSNRGSLYRLLHKSGAREQLDERRRLSMAYDVVCLFSFLYISPVWVQIELITF